MARLRGRHDAPSPSGNVHNQVRQHAVYSQILARLSRSAAAKAAQEAAQPSRTVVGGVAGYAKKIGSGIGGRIGRQQLLPPPGSFRPNEVLAINANPASLARVIASGQARVIEEIRLPALRTNITRLETPHGPSSAQQLREVLSAEAFSLNLVYRSVVSPPAETSQSATSPQPAPQPLMVPQSGAVPTGAGAGSVLVKPGVVGCTPDRCFGSGLIKWQPHLATCVSKALKIGVIDTGLDKSHPAFADVHFVHKETEFLPPKSKKPSNQHGTGIFSLLAGNKNSTTPGLIPDASYYVGDAFYTDGEGLAISDTTTMLKALNWLKSERVDIANLSFAGPKDDLVHAAIVELASTGTVIVAAAGNEGPDAPPSYPAAFPRSRCGYSCEQEAGTLSLCQPRQLHCGRGSGSGCVDSPARQARGAANRHFVRSAICHVRDRPGLSFG